MGNDEIELDLRYSTKLDDLEFDDVQNIFNINLEGTNIDDEMVRAALTDKSYATSMTIEWMNDYFQYGDFKPNGDGVYLPIDTIKELYNEYKADMQLRDFYPKSVVDSTKFGRIWNKLYPKTRLRAWIDIPGKCDICMEIDIMRRKTSRTEIQNKALQQAHILHRGGMIMLERQKYKNRIFNALKPVNQEERRILSLIIDGMDQYHSRCPHLGNQGQFSKPLSQSITGALIHG
eukprot:gene18073-25359_t